MENALSLIGQFPPTMCSVTPEQRWEEDSERVEGNGNL